MRLMLLPALLRVAFGFVSCLDQSTYNMTVRTVCGTTCTESCVRGLRVALNSECPSGAWLDAIGPMVAQKQMLFLNIGANKGYAVADFMMRFAPGDESAYETCNVTYDGWHKQLQVLAKGKMERPKLEVAKLCGACSDCTKSRPPAVPHRHAERSKIRVLAVELLQSNARRLESLFKHFGVAGEVIHAAASNATGVARISDNEGKNDEVNSVVDGASSDTSSLTELPLVSVDAVLNERRISRVDLLTIDTEGHDALVLEGAMEALRSRRVRLVEFEYHGCGMWASSSGSGRSLRTTLDTLHRHAGFRCFWQGDARPAPYGGNSSLVTVDAGGAWCEAYEFRGWSNLICAHTDDRPVITALDELARIVQSKAEEATANAETARMKRRSFLALAAALRPRPKLAKAPG